MPFRSKAQQGFLFLHHPEVAREFADATTDYNSLPEHVRGKEGSKKEEHGESKKKEKSERRILFGKR